MKKIVFALATLAIVSCKEEEVKPVDYILISGRITNNTNDSIVVQSYSSRDFRKVIPINKNGEFSDTLRIDDNLYMFHNYKDAQKLYLKKGNTINITLDENNFKESISIDGANTDLQNYFTKSDELIETAYDNLSKTEVTTYTTKLSNIKETLTANLNQIKNLDSILIANELKGLEQSLTSAKKYYDHVQELKKLIGQPSPVFESYENFKGGTTSLSDLKGKYVYIDIWATWCGPCKKEIPALKEIEAKYHGKNIEFVSISVDQQKSKQKWKDMVTEKQMGGVQLIADKDWGSNFIKDYNVKGIPRFILLDTEGKIINAFAPKPSEEKLIDQINSLNI